MCSSSATRYRLGHTRKEDNYLAKGNGHPDSRWHAALKPKRRTRQLCQNPIMQKRVDSKDDRETKLTCPVGELQKICQVWTEMFLCAAALLIASSSRGGTRDTYPQVFLHFQPPHGRLVLFLCLPRFRQSLVLLASVVSADH